MNTPDELLTYPHQIKLNIQNCLDSIECTIAFDVRDWSEDNRSAWIYGIVFGWEESMNDIAKEYHWGEATIKRLKKLHEQWVKLKQMQEVNANTEGSDTNDNT